MIHSLKLSRLILKTVASHNVSNVVLLCLYRRCFCMRLNLPRGRENSLTIALSSIYLASVLFVNSTFLGHDSLPLV